MIPLPTLLAPFVGRDGKILSPWNSYLQQFTQAPPNILNITLTSSPFSYQAKEPGVMAITGGTISDITLRRGTVGINATGEKLIPVSINDVIEITYSVTPTVQFIPSYGNRTG